MVDLIGSLVLVLVKRILLFLCLVTLGAPVSKEKIVSCQWRGLQFIQGVPMSHPPPANTYTLIPIHENTHYQPHKMKALIYITVKIVLVFCEFRTLI